MIQELYFGPHIMGHHGTWLKGQGQLMANLDMSTTCSMSIANMQYASIAVCHAMTKHTFTNNMQLCRHARSQCTALTTCIHIGGGTGHPKPLHT